jgi:hypothetical protein
MMELTGGFGASRGVVYGRRIAGGHLTPGQFALFMARCS